MGNVTLDTGDYWLVNQSQIYTWRCWLVSIWCVVRVATSSAGDGSPHNLMILDLHKEWYISCLDCSIIQTNSDDYN